MCDTFQGSIMPMINSPGMELIFKGDLKKFILDKLTQLVPVRILPHYLDCVPCFTKLELGSILDVSNWILRLLIKYSSILD
jgi:hypothetical protein